jgi:hypothetical protein
LFKDENSLEELYQERTRYIMKYYPSETLVIPLTTIRRERLLPVSGEVLVDIGEMVEPFKVVARAYQPGDFRIIDVTRKLSIGEWETKEYMLKEVDAPVRKGEVIAAKGKLFRRVCRSPVDGFIAAVRGGLVIIESTSAPIEVCAYLRGKVASLMPDYGVVVETIGALIQGIWGTGGESYGIMKLLAEDRTEPLRDEAIDIGCKGTIIVGSSVDEEALLKAEEVGVKGIVVGSIEAGLVNLAGSLPFPIIVTEGMGRTPMASITFDLLSANDGKEASISGKMHPEVVIPVSPPGMPVPMPPKRGVPLKIGDLVKVLRGPYFGSIGEVKALPKKARWVDSGARLKGAEVELEGEGVVFVPWQNLELIKTEER